VANCRASLRHYRRVEKGIKCWRVAISIDFEATAQPAAEASDASRRGRLPRAIYGEGSDHVVLTKPRRRRRRKDADRFSASDTFMDTLREMGLLSWGGCWFIGGGPPLIQELGHANGSLFSAKRGLIEHAPTRRSTSPFWRTPDSSWASEIDRQDVGFMGVRCDRRSTSRAR